MQKTILLSLIFFIPFFSHSQDTAFYNSNGINHDVLPVNARIVDTTYGVIFSQIHQYNLYGNSGNSFSNDIVKLFSNCVINSKRKYIARVKINANATISGTLRIDTNSVFADSIQFNGVSSETTFVYTLSECSIVHTRILNPKVNESLPVAVSISEERVNINFKTPLPSVDTIFVDQNDSVFAHIPIDYSAFDTITIKTDSIFYSTRLATDNSNSGNSIRFQSNSGKNYFLASYVGVLPYYSLSLFSMDTNTVLYKKPRIFTSYPTKLNYFFKDTIRLNSNAVVDFNITGGKNGGVNIVYEAFSTVTKIYIKSVVGMNENGVNKDQIHIYPNPAHDKITVTGFTNANEQYLIYDLSGKVLQSGVIQKGEMLIGELNSGIYIVNFPESGIRKKLVKN